MSARHLDRQPVDAGAPAAPPRARRRARAHLERTPPGFWGWLTTVDHKAIGKRYIVTAFVFFLARRHRGRADARCSSRAPRTRFIGPDLYNQIFTMHGTTMMFLFAVPIMDGDGALPRAADGRHAQRRVPAAERLRLLASTCSAACSSTSRSS